MKQTVLLSDVLLPHITKALGLEEYSVQSISLYLETGEPVQVSVDMLGTENLKNVQWQETPDACVHCHKPYFETKGHSEWVHSPHGDVFYQTNTNPEQEGLADGTY